MTEQVWTGPPLIIERPKTHTSAAVYSSPHSGRTYPRAFQAQSVLDQTRLRASEDAFIDTLFSAAPSGGAPLLKACFPRAFVDANRSAGELDPIVIDLPGKKRASAGLRVHAGLGVIPRVVAEGANIYHGKLSYAEAEARLKACYRPYHRALEDLLRESRDIFGIALLFDCHSMPSASQNLRGGQLPDVVIGNCFGSSAAGWISKAVAEIFAGSGLKVGFNSPFPGGYITQHYGKPRQNIHAVQIEINRRLYLDEGAIVPNRDYDAFAERMQQIVVQLCRVPHQGGTALAAE